jgi:hypothetical protein
VDVFHGEPVKNGDAFEGVPEGKGDATLGLKWPEDPSLPELMSNRLVGQKSNV